MGQTGRPNKEQRSGVVYELVAHKIMNREQMQIGETNTFSGLLSYPSSYVFVKQDADMHALALFHLRLCEWTFTSKMGVARDESFLSHSVCTARTLPPRSCGLRLHILRLRWARPGLHRSHTVQSYGQPTKSNSAARPTNSCLLLCHQADLLEEGGPQGPNPSSPLSGCLP